MAKAGALVKRVEIGMSLRVEGVLVTTANASDVLGDGKVHYDAASKTLTLENAEIKTEVAGQEGIYSNIPDLVIKLVGSNTMISSKASSGIM